MFVYVHHAVWVISVGWN